LITVTLGQIRRGDVAQVRGMRGVYIVRDGQTILYIGKTEKRDIEWRMRAHLGQGSGPFSRPTMLGKLALQHESRSDRWQVAVWSLDDCNQFFEQRGLPQRRKVPTAEEALIRFYCPCLNVRSCATPAALPRVYR
jgi:hypothetical protein